MRQEAPPKFDNYITQARSKDVFSRGYGYRTEEGSRQAASLSALDARDAALRAAGASPTMAKGGFKAVSPSGEGRVKGFPTQ